jgi:hypothetical protein
MARNAFTIIEDLRNRLAELQLVLDPLAALGNSLAPPTKRAPALARVRRSPRSGQRTSSKKVVRRSQRPVSAKVRAQRAIHGKYLGSIRPLSKPDRAKVKQVQATKGYPAAIALAKKLKK